MKHHKLFFAIIFSFLMPFCATAQVQQGYVKTRGRLGSDGTVIPGEGIENVTVKVKNEGTVISDNSGRFEIALRNEKYYLENVTKKGYLLVDADILSKQYTRSVDTFKIVLTTPEQQLEDELASERKLRRTLTRKLHQREDEIEELYETSKIIKAERDSALRKLYAYHADNEKLIKDMVERYSRIDYDQLDDFNRRISEYILNGELLKADSMINSKGDIHSRIEEYRTHKQLNEDKRAELDQREKDLAKSEELERKKLADLAGDCYSKFEIFKMQHLNDSAAYYIELRASLDTTNVAWQLNAGNYITIYQAKYDDALKYFNRALNVAKSKYGEFHNDVAASYSNFGVYYSVMSNNEKALEYYEKALNIYMALGRKYQDCVANEYKNIGVAHSVLCNMDSAIVCYEKSLEIYKGLYDEMHINIADLYKEIGAVYNILADTKTAIEYYNSALRIYLALGQERTIRIASLYDDLGVAYSTSGHNSAALVCHNKALEIYKILLSGNHSSIARCLSNIGVVYSNMADYTTALDYYEDALRIQKQCYNENHLSIAANYNNCAVSYQFLGEKDKALRLFNEALRIRLEILGEKNVIIARSYRAIGDLYVHYQEFDNAINTYNKELDVYASKIADNLREYIECYIRIGEVYCAKRAYDIAMSYFESSLNILHKYDNYDISLEVLAYNRMGCVSVYCEKISKAIEYYKKSIKLYKTTPNKYNWQLAGSYNDIGMIYFMKKDFSKALKCFDESISYCQGEMNAEAKMLTLNIYNNRGLCLLAKKKYEDALKCFGDARSMAIDIYGEKHQNVSLYEGNLGIVCVKLKRFQEGYDYLRKSYEILKDVLPKSDSGLMDIYMHLKIAEREL